MASPVRDTAWLEWMAGLMGAGSRRKQTAVLPPQKFHCLLDELPLHLVPRRVFDRVKLDRVKLDRQKLDREKLDREKLNSAPSQPLFLNPNCFVLPAGEIPKEFESCRDLLDGFHLQTPIAWVRNPASGGLNPFWLGPALTEILSRLQPGVAVPDSIPDEIKFILAASGILTGANENERALEKWKALAELHADEFRQKNYTPIAGLLHPFHLAALRRYYRHQIRAGAIWLGDEQSSRRYVAHNEPVARFFHHQLATLISAIAGEAVKPSYVYLGSYLSGAELKKHTDREQCEFSMTLCLDFSPEPEVATSWPIRLDTPDGSVALYQALGDALVYRGTKVPHYRSVLGEGHTSTSIFFHYVPEDFSGPLD